MNYSDIFDLIRNYHSYLSYYLGNGKALKPFRYSLELTYRCNLNCPFCYVGSLRNLNELSKEEWFGVIDQIPFWGFITLVGGEPLLRNDFLEILDKSLKKVQGRVNVVSNGILLTEEISKHFIDKKLLLLSVSLDGYGETHDKNRNREGIFEKAVTNLKTLIDMRKGKKYPLLDIKTIVMENNLDDLVKLYQLCDELGIEFLSLSFLRNNNLKQSSNLREAFGEEFWKQDYPIKSYFDINHFKEVYGELQGLAAKGKTKLRFAPKFKENGHFQDIDNFFQDNISESTSKIYKPCLYPWSNVIINPEGEIYPCLSFKIGNVRNSSFMEVWNNKRFISFRRNLRKNKVFSSCQMCCELTPKNISGTKAQKKNK
ncbi:MAG: radical SAM protein [Candidatus Portnoybacteria bacterium]|nr:radical SAM protein [Candidatus Portnoybacteria bacterium]